MKKNIFFIILFFISLLIVALFSSMFFLQKKAVDKLASTQLQEQTNDKVAFFNHFVKHHIELVQATISNDDLLYFVKNKNKNKNKNHKEVIEHLFMTQAKTHPELFQLRYINAQGNEVVRVDNYNEPELILGSKLQNKKNRYYFLETMKLSEGEIYFSNFDLNVERNHIETAYIPTMRIAMPIIIAEQKFGIVIININISEFLFSLQHMPLHYMSIIYDDGHIIIDKNSDYNWSRDFNHNVKIFDLYPYLPKNFSQYSRMNNESFYIERLPINSKNGVFMLLLPKEFKQYEFLGDYLKGKWIMLIVFFIFGMAMSYVIAQYVEKLFKQHLSFEQIKSNNILITSVMNASKDMIYYKDENLNYIGCNRIFENFIGKQEYQVIGKNDFKLFDSHKAKELRKRDEEILRNKQIVVQEETLTYANGEIAYMEYKYIPFEYNDFNNMGILTIGHDITKHHNMAQQIKEESYKDSLTNVYNRKAYDEKIDEHLELYKRYSGHFCIAMIDIDDFKKINDSLGHDYGDKVLIEMTKLIQTLIRKTDILFRVGGEEFVLLFPKTSIQNSYLVLDKIRSEIFNYNFIDERDVSVSCGLVQVRVDDTVESLYKRADKLLYKTKNNGKNGISIELETDDYQI